MNKKLHNIFSNHGIFIEKNEENELLSLSSLTFISIVVNIENEFEIVIPDKYLNSEKLSTFSDFEKVVKEQIQLLKL